MKTKKSVLKNRTVSIPRAESEFDGQRNLQAEVKHRVVSQNYQDQILTLSNDL